MWTAFYGGGYFSGLRIIARSAFGSRRPIYAGTCFVLAAHERAVSLSACSGDSDDCREGAEYRPDPLAGSAAPWLGLIFAFDAEELRFYPLKVTKPLVLVDQVTAKAGFQFFQHNKAV